MKALSPSFLIFTSLFFLPLAAQSQQDTVGALAASATHFQQWLDHSKLSEQMTLKDYRLDDTGLLTLRLAFKVSQDSVPAAWENLKSQYVQANIEPLTEALFYKAIHSFNSLPEQTEVVILDTYQPFLPPCLTIRIFEESLGSLIIEDDPCLSDTAEVWAPLTLLEKEKSTVSAGIAIGSEAATQELYDFLYAKADSYFAGGGRSGVKSPSLKIARLRQGGDCLRFSVRNIKEELLDPAWWRSFSAHEKLDFTVRIAKDQVSLEVDGSYGSALWVPLVSGYIPVEPEHEEEAREYCSWFLDKYLLGWVKAFSH